MPGSEKEYEYWGKRASTHDNDFLYIVGPTIPREIKEWLVLQFEVTDMVLELGCGSGGFSEMIADKVKYLTATDLAPEMVAKARGKLSQFGNVEVQKEDCYDTSFTDNIFDAVLMVNLLHIVKEPVMVLEESRRVLKDDGRVVIVDVTGYGMPFFSKMSLGVRYMKKWRRPAPYSRNFAPGEVTEIAQEAGFVIEGAKLLGKDTKAVCVRGRKITGDMQNER
jgi:Methylase involved in ubiquinone/menaquinone biosynthesis